MDIIAFNASPRITGNTSRIVAAILSGARSAGAATQEVRLHDIAMKGCQGCLGCRRTPGVCRQQDALSPHLEAIKSCKGIVVATPIYMYHIAGQMKLFVDRIYSLYASKNEDEYYSAVPPGKTYALVTSQGSPDPMEYERPIRYLSRITGSGLGFNIVGQIIHADSHVFPAEKMRNSWPRLQR